MSLFIIISSSSSISISISIDDSESTETGIADAISASPDTMAATTTRSGFETES